MKKGSDIQIPDEWRIVVARNFEEIEAIRPIWEQMQRNEPLPVPNADIDRYLSVIKAIGDDVQPYVMLLEHNNCPAAMIICRIEKHQLELKLGYKALLKPRLTCLTVVYGGVLGMPASQECALLIHHLIEALKIRQADLIQFNHLRIGSTLYQLARKIPNVLTRDHFIKADPHLRIEIPGDIDQFLRTCSKNRRKHLMRYLRKLEDKYPGRVQMVTYTRVDELEEAMNAAARISSGTYQDGLGHGFVPDARMRMLLTVAARKNWLRFDVLYVDEEPCAFRYALNCGNTCFGMQTAYSPEWREYNVGTLLFFRLVESLCKDSTIKYFDFGFGGGEHKEWGVRECWQEASISIFATRLYPVIINILRSSMSSLNAGLHYIVQKIGSVGWIKRKWRNLLQAKNPGSKCRVGR